MVDYSCKEFILQQKKYMVEGQDTQVSYRTHVSLTILKFTIMIQVFFFLFFLFIGTFIFVAHGQTNKILYTYDNAGNRIARQVVQVPIRSFSQLNENEKLQYEESWNDKLSRNKVNIYPNPVQTELVVFISELPDPGYGQLIMFDMEGRQMYKGNITTTYTIVQMDSFETGVYIMKLIFGEQQSVWKVIKK